MHANNGVDYDRRGKEKDTERLLPKKEDREVKQIIEPISLGTEKNQAGRDTVDVSSKPEQVRRGAESSPKAEQVRRTVEGSSKIEKVRRGTESAEGVSGMFSMYQ